MGGAHESMMATSDGGFQTTRWTLIQSLREGDAEERRKALATLATRYWPPVYAALRRMGRDRDAAAEVAQAFFADVILTRSLFQQADHERGRLRALLIAALKRFVIDQHRRSAADGAQAPLSLDLDREECYLQREQSRSVEEVFERRWAVAMLEDALSRCERHFCENGSEAHWRAFETAVVRPASIGQRPPRLAEIAAELGFASPIHVASATKVVRKRLRLLLREVAAEHAVDESAQELEYQRLIQVLGG